MEVVVFAPGLGRGLLHPIGSNTGSNAGPEPDAGVRSSPDPTSSSAAATPLGPVEPSLLVTSGSVAASSIGASGGTLGTWARTLGLAGARILARPLRAEELVWQVTPGDTVTSIYDAMKARGMTIDEDAFRRRLHFQHPGIDIFDLRPGQILRFAPVEPRAPTGSELLRSPIVRRAIELAWSDSKADDPTARHEEGGWIYMNTGTGQVFTHRAIPGAVASIDLSAPIEYVDAVVVGTFHTHPHPPGEGWITGPSSSDIQMETSRGTPGLIRSEGGLVAYGPERRLSLEGSWAYPGTPERPLT